MPQPDMTHNIEDMLKAVFKDESDCEIENHFTCPRYHSGKGVWYATVHCPSCKITTTTLTCERYRNTILGLTDTTATCEECEYPQLIGEAITSWVHRG